ncbi:S8 family serine peptidase [Sporosalibacterium faouarense]|uniref:S8 family serine peptidase n=1 Tax=Sporosalibacterium faouarense TaxID=516123 RepID=UPI001FAF4AAE|nr:S8 family serine peptidase [Sporosalibacterium faouarense]
MRKLMSCFLVLVLMFGTISTVMATPDKEVLGTKTTKEVKKPTGEKLSLDSRVNSLKENDQLRIIVELKEEPVIQYATEEGVKVNQLSSSKVESITKNLIQAQKELKNQIKSESINIEYHNQFVNVVNGFSATTTYSEAKRIEKLPNVKSVTVANEYDRPEPDMSSSKEIVKAVKAWQESGYTGAGMVVAILDTGIDYNHRDMVLSNLNRATLNKQVVESLISTEGLPGKWYTDKVPYGYNYMDNNDTILDLGPDASMHGMHVAGTVGANGDEDNGGIKGVAPEVQLLAMKVFGNDPGMPSTFGDVIIKAIDDSIVIGADVINMSLGSTSGFVLPNDPEQMAVTRAVENGVFCAISAGNSNHIGDGWDNPLIKNPDIGVVGTPGSTSESLQVASIENTNVIAKAFEYGDDELAGYTLSGPNPVGLLRGPQEYVYCGLGGTAEDFEGIDLEGKVALIKRGEYAFTEKIMNAQNRGAVAVIVFNQTLEERPDGGGEELINMQYPEDGNIPAMFIANSDGEILLQLIPSGENTVEFNGESKTVLNPNKGKMSTFTSWGTPANLDFKPEITAPGGQIYSTLNNDEYGIMSGTSMAAPHVAGGAALVLQMVEDKFPSLVHEDKVNMAKNILMSTAEPLGDHGANNEYFGLSEYNYTSPRRQGAGVMNLYAATFTPAYVVDKSTDLSKVNLKEIDDDTEFTLTVKNFSNETVSYAVYGTVGTDLRSGDYNLLETSGIYDVSTLAEDGPNGFYSGEFPISFRLDDGTVVDNVYDYVEVPAGQSVDFDVEIDLSNAVDWNYNYPLSMIYPNGTFVEGFVRLVDMNDGSNPELSIPYLGFYGEWDEVPIIDTSIYENDISFYEITCMVDGEGYFLGQKLDGTYDESKIAISPDGDGWFDSANSVLSFLRNAKEVEVRILDEEGNPLRTVYKENDVRKNYYDGGNGTTYNYKPQYLWDAKVNNKVVEDGQYYYEVLTKADYPNAEWQSVEFPIIVDTVDPVIDTVDYTNGADTLAVTASDEGAGISAFYLVEGSEIVLESEDGIFDLGGLEARPYAFTLVTEDYAGNQTVYPQPIIVGDSTIPYIMADSPEAFGIYTVSDILIKGSIVDATAINEFEINGQSIPVTYNPATGNFDFETTLSFEDGMHKIDFTAVDVVNNEINFERKIFVDTNAPVIDMTQEPTETVVESNVESITLGANITDNLPDLKVSVNGSMITNISEDWSYFDALDPASYELNEEVALEYGENIITIEAEDGAGNVTVKEFSVFRKEVDGEAPIEITSIDLDRTEYVSSDRPVVITATANQEVNWTVNIVDPNGSVVDTFTAIGANFSESWAPDQFKKLNGEYTVEVSATKDEFTVKDEETFNVYNYPVKINEINVINQGGYIAVEAAMENLGPDDASPMLVIQVTDEWGYVVNISTAKMAGLRDGQIINLSSGFGLSKSGQYNVDVYVWNGWEDTKSLSSPDSTTFVIE